MLSSEVRELTNVSEVRGNGVRGVALRLALLPKDKDGRYEGGCC